jgi:hypothetical protein
MNATTTPAKKELSQSADAVRRRAKREAERAFKQASDQSIASVPKAPVAKVAAPKTRKQPTAAPIKINAAQKRTIGQVMAAVASGFLPIASFVLAHYESKTQPMLWILVAAALMFSAPTLAKWAEKWCGSQVKAWGFTVLLEGVMVASHTEWLSYAGLVILVVINATNAYGLAARKQVAE